jgi:hypothetical protein
MSTAVTVRVVDSSIAVHPAEAMQTTRLPAGKAVASMAESSKTRPKSSLPGPGRPSNRPLCQGVSGMAGFS